MADEVKTVVNVPASHPPDIATKIIDKVDAGSTAIVVVAGAVLWMARGQVKRMVESYCEMNREMIQTLKDLKVWGIEEQQYRDETKKLLEQNSEKLDYLYKKANKFKRWFL